MEPKSQSQYNLGATHPTPPTFNYQVLWEKSTACKIACLLALNLPWNLQNAAIVNNIIRLYLGLRLKSTIYTRHGNSAFFTR